MDARRCLLGKLIKVLSSMISNRRWLGTRLNVTNSYSFNFNSRLRKRHTGFYLLPTPSPRGKQFLRFFLLKKTFFMSLLRIDIPYLCPNMTYVDALDFSAWHSEEVISFFWRSVYIQNAVSRRKPTSTVR